MTHFHGTGSLAPAILQCLSPPATVISLSPSHSMFRHSAPSPHSLGQELSVFIWSPLSQAILYLPRVTKLLRTSDKARNPGTGTWGITSLAVCLSLIFRPAGSQTHTPLSHEGSYDCFFFFSFSRHCQVVACFLIATDIPSPQQPFFTSYQTGVATKRGTKKRQSFTSKHADFTHSHFQSLIRRLNHFFSFHIRLTISQLKVS